MIILFIICILSTFVFGWYVSILFYRTLFVNSLNIMLKISIIATFMDPLAEIPGHDPREIFAIQAAWRKASPYLFRKDLLLASYALVRHIKLKMFYFDHVTGDFLHMLPSRGRSY